MSSRTKNTEEENFLVSSADLMACVLFVFILLAVVFAMRARQTEAGLRDQQRKWGDTSKARSTLLEGLRSALISNGVKVTINEEGDGLFFPEGTLRFAQCSSKFAN